MNEKELQNFLLKNFPKENEKCDWKGWGSLKHDISGRRGEDAISYITAISNMGGGNLIIGVEDKTLEILGINNFCDFTAENVKLRILGNCLNLPSEKFEIESITTSDTNKTIWILHIPKHPFRLPVYAHNKPWQRVGDSLVEMRQERLAAIINETSENNYYDWTAKIVKEANITDLDPAAIKKAREQFIIRNPKYIGEILNWSDAKFLDKAKLTISGQITRTSLILLGKEESEHLLDSAVKISWQLRSLNNQIKAGDISSIPFILAVDDVFAKIRNLKYVHLGSNTLFPDEFLRYEPFSIRESINNAIAHQDYEKKGRINVVEFEDDHLIFSNCGSFLPKSIEDVVLKDSPEEIYRNPFLVEAMKNVNMIETHGGGIRKIFNFQRKRFFPMPDYDFSDNKVKVKIIGKIIDEGFFKILSRNPDLAMHDILLLDKVQKKQQHLMSDEEFRHLKKNKFVEGRRKNNSYLSCEVIEPTKNDELKAQYILNRGVDDSFLKELILKYLKQWGGAKRNKIEQTLWPKLPESLSDKSKKIKIYHLLQSLKKTNKIRPGIKKGCWELSDR